MSCIFNPWKLRASFSTKRGPMYVHTAAYLPRKLPKTIFSLTSLAEAKRSHAAGSVTTLLDTRLNRKLQEFCSRGRVRGTVGFYGMLRLFCLLGSSAERIPEAGCIGTLSPLDGTESFAPVPLIDLQESPLGVDSSGRPRFCVELPKIIAASPEALNSEIALLRAR